MLKTINPMLTIQAIQKELAELELIKGTRPPIYGYLKDLGKDLSGAPETVAIKEAIIKQFPGLPEEALSKMMSQATGGKQAVPKASIAELQRTQKELFRRAKINPANPDPVTHGYEGKLKHIATEMFGDVEPFLQKNYPDVLEGQRGARDAFKAGQELIENTYVNKIRELADGNNYEKIADAVLNPGTPIGEYSTIFNVLGDAGNDVKATILSKFFEKSKSKTTGGFIPSGLGAQIKTWGHGKREFGMKKLEALYTPAEIKIIKKVDEMAKAIGRGDVLSRSSPTGYLMRTMAMARQLSSLPFAGSISGVGKILVNIVGSLGFDAFIASSYGKKWLTEGLATWTPKTPIATTVAAGVGVASASSISGPRGSSTQ